MVPRRAFLKHGGLALAGVSLAPGFLARAAACTGERRQVLVTIFQRGGADGLNAIVPFGDADYYAARPTIAVPPPGSGPDGAIDLDGFFGMHPRLGPLAPLYRAGQLAIVHASGSPHPTRSHLEAQEYMESGTPGTRAASDGWIDRCLDAGARARRAPCRAVAAAPLLPRALEGSGAAVRALRPERGRAAGRDEYPDTPLGRSLDRIARLVRADAGIEIAVVESGGWDHHADAGGAGGRLAARLDDLARGLAAFVRDLDDRFADVVVVTMSEFGRAVAENARRGTEHGHGQAMLVLGGAVRGGRVYGAWPGLARERRHEGRDLAVTTDFRTVFAEVVRLHLGVRDLARVFPRFDSPADLGLLHAGRGTLPA